MELARLFVETFPQLEDVRFTHSWAGAIDTCSRFCAFFDRSPDGRTVSAAGYTGLGVGASRFGGRVMLDLLAGEETELTRLRFVRDKPIPFPPEPIHFAGIELTRRSMARADERGGRRNLWLRTLDRLGMGFDSDWDSRARRRFRASDADLCLRLHRASGLGRENRNRVGGGPVGWTGHHPVRRGGSGAAPSPGDRLKPAVGSLPVGEPGRAGARGRWGGGPRLLLGGGRRRTTGCSGAVQRHRPGPPRSWNPRWVRS